MLMMVSLSFSSCLTAVAAAPVWVARASVVEGRRRREVKKATGGWETAVIIRSAVTHLHALDGLK